MTPDPEQKPKPETIETIEDLKDLLKDMRIDPKIIAQIDVEAALRELKRRTPKT